MRGKNVVSFGPESEYYHQKCNFDLQHLTKMIWLLQVFAIDLNVKTEVFRIYDQG